MNIVDILIHVHPDLSAEQRTKVEDSVSAHDGVVSIHFSAEHPHELVAAYDPEAINSDSILEQVRQWDKSAMMAGL